MQEKLKARDRTDSVVVHFTGNEATHFKKIREEHLKQGLEEIGFHYVIEEDGKMLMGRHQSKTGAHYAEFDESSIGICIIGEKDGLNEEQTVAYNLLLDKLRKDYPDLQSIKYVYRTME